ncbi:MAG: LptF/LptG family permease [Rhodospirillaceae bacterium]|nr:LptF/LptG family permease [Rhodospirillales bacterium]
MATPVFNRLDRYLLAAALRPLASTLTIVLLALLMERLLRLFRLVASGGGPLDLVAWMALNLVPHYLGLAIPAALFFTIHAVVSRLDADSELDALRGAGISRKRTCRAFLLLALSLGIATLAVVGWLQPLGRYQYRALSHAVSQQVWDGVLPAGALVQAGDGLLISAERVQAGGSRLERVFVRQSREDGTVTVTTARFGRMVMAADRIHMRILLEDGEQLRRAADGGAQVLRFTALTDVVAVRVVPVPFRARGAEERELTLPELVSRQGAIPHHRLAAELHARLVRAASLPFLPMLAVGLGVTAKRTPRGFGLVAGGLLLFLYHHALLTGESLAESGRADPVTALWGPFLLFAAINLWLYLGLDRGPVPILAWGRR